MNYQKLYDALCQRGKTQRDVNNRLDQHHIVPRKQGGSDYPSNLTKLYPKEHRLAHLLLYKITGDIYQKIAANYIGKAPREGSNCEVLSQEFLAHMGKGSTHPLWQSDYARQKSAEVRRTEASRRRASEGRMEYVYIDWFGEVFTSRAEMARRWGVSVDYIQNSVYRNHGVFFRVRLRKTEPKGR